MQTSKESLERELIQVRLLVDTLQDDLDRVQATVSKKLIGEQLNHYEKVIAKLEFKIYRLGGK
ncbi:hypothetical protein D1872_51490 [compost metagenome]